MAKLKIDNIKINKRLRKDVGSLEDLKNSIQHIGLLHPIVVDENYNLIAGFRRLLAYKELGEKEIEANIIKIEDNLRGEYDENVVRKNFTPSEAVAIWETIESHQGEKGLPPKLGRREKAIKITGVSKGSLDKAKQIVEFGDEKLIKEMDESGNIDRVFKKVKTEKKKKELKEKVKNYQESPDIKIWQGDFRELTKNIQDNSIDLILTDPPYPEQYLNLWQDLFIISQRVLKPSGFLVAYSGQMYLDKILKMKNDLIYYWTMNIEFTKKPLIPARNVLNSWKPILVFQKAPLKKTENAFSDKINFDYNEERELHPDNWGQTVEPFEQLLNNFSQVGDLVLDPMAGTGTTLIACKNQKRKAIGIEIDKEMVDIIKSRL